MGHTDAVAGTVVRHRSGFPRRRVLGLPVDALTLEQAAGVAAEAITMDRSLRVAVTNANKAWLARRDEGLRSFLEHAELVVPEYATVWAARRTGVTDLHHVGGLTLMMRLLEDAARERWGVYLLGARDPVVSGLRRRLETERGIRVVGHHHGYLDAVASERLVRQLERVRPDLLFVAMGSPLQERFLAELPAGAARVAIGVGGSFDVLAGIRRDTPSWARGRGLEWLHRLQQDPARLWKRYLVTNSWFVWRTLVARLAQGRPRLRGR